MAGDSAVSGALALTKTACGWDDRNSHRQDCLCHPGSITDGQEAGLTRSLRSGQETPALHSNLKQRARANARWEGLGRGTSDGERRRRGGRRQRLPASRNGSASRLQCAGQRRPLHGQRRTAGRGKCKRQRLPPRAKAARPGWNAPGKGGRYINRARMRATCEAVADGKGCVGSILNQSKAGQFKTPTLRKTRRVGHPEIQRLGHPPRDDNARLKTDEIVRSRRLALEHLPRVNLRIGAA